MRLITLLLPLALVGVVLSQPAHARGLEQIRYELFKNPQADVEDDLRRLAARGDRVAMLMLGDVLAAGDVTATQETIALYDAAFAYGRGEVTALRSLVRIMEQYPYRREQYREYFRQALLLYPHNRDRQTLATTLEVFLNYPELFDPAGAERLIELHQRSCLVDCGTDLYRALLAERKGDLPTADTYYRAAIFYDSRAAERYYIFLGERQDLEFPRIARELEPRVDEMTADAVVRISRVLDRISDLYRIDEQLAEQQRHQQAELLGIELEPVPPGFVPESERLFLEALRWVEYAVARNWLPALVSRYHFMTSMPDNYSGAEAMALIERIGLQDPLRARSLRASALMVTNWNTLNPTKAHELIQAIIADGDAEGQMLLADLYSRGGLDEPDQDTALGIYHQLAKGGSGAAFHRQATLFTSGRAICHDYTRAYAYALIAFDFGAARARSLIRLLDAQLDEEEKAQAFGMRNTIIRELGI